MSKSYPFTRHGFAKAKADYQHEKLVKVTAAVAVLSVSVLVLGTLPGTAIVAYQPVVDITIKAFKAGSVVSGI